jgi:hypothetical protein
MRSPLMTALLGVAACLVHALPPDADAQTILYKPPERGSPSADIRVGGAIRGIEYETVALDILAPGHVGLTTSTQPRLYWFTAGTVDLPIEVTLVADDAVDPLMWLKLPPPIAGGIHEVDLQTQGVRLTPGKLYQWFVAIVPDPENRSSDVVAGGEIELVAPAADVQARLSASGPAERPVAYAASGYWYDALQSLAMLIEESDDSSARELRASLLEQVGLAEVARYERSRP